MPAPKDVADSTHRVQMAVQPTRASDAAVARVVARLTGQYFLRFARQAAEAEGGDFMNALVLHAILAGNNGARDNDPKQADHFRSLQDVAPDSSRRPVSILAVANSLGLPYETVRRCVNRLIKSGRCGRVKGGIIALESGLRRPEDDEGLLKNVANVRYLYRALKRARVDLD
jgi:hypothetical protein